MEIDDPNYALAIIKSAIGTRDSNALSNAVVILEVSLLGEVDTLPDVLFEELISILSSDEAKQMDGSYPLLYYFESDWEKLTPDQRERLLRFIESSYAEYVDDTGRLVMAEILGTYFANEAALGVITAFQRSPDESVRAFVPLALEDLVQSSTDPDVCSRARQYLESMASDPSAIVRQEVEESMNRLGLQP